MNSLDYIVNKVLNVIRNDTKKKTSSYDAVGTVTRVEDNIAWVHFDNGVSETPIAKSINCSKGDKVRVRVTGGTAFLVGNDTAPPSDDTEALVAKAVAKLADSKAESAETTATDAQETAEQAANVAGTSLVTDTLYYLATTLSSGVTTSTAGWTTTVQTMDATNKYLWTYHKYTKANGNTVDSTPALTGRYGEDGTSVSILGSYSSYADLVAAHPTGSTGDAYMVGNDLYVWNGSAWEDVGQIKGEDGVGVASITEHYARSASKTTAPTSWSTTAPELTSTYKYLWNYETITYTNSSTSDTAPHVVGAYGDSGKGISSIAEYYAVNNSTTPPADSSFSTTIATPTASNRYLWNYEITTYSDSSTSNTGKRIICVYGEKGNAGISISSVTEYYLATSASSGVTTSTSGWTTAIQSMTSTKQYLWNYEVVKGSDNSTLNTTSPVIIGRYGQNGSNGKSISSIIEWYQVSSSNSTPPATPTASGTGYSSTPVATTTTNKYLWNYEVINYSSGDPTITAARVIGTHGDTGAQGISISSVQPQYYLSTSSSTATGGSWGTTLAYESGKYIWTRDLVTYSNNTTSTSTEIYNEALTTACADAISALATAQNVEQHFWNETSGTDAGAHITEYPKDEWTDSSHTNYHKGANLLLLSNTIKLRNALNTLAELASTGLKVYEPNDSTNPVAQFLGTGVQIGKGTSNYIKITPSYGLRFYWNNNLRAEINGDGITYEQGNNSIVMGASQLDCFGAYVEAPDICLKWGSGDGIIGHYKPVMGIPALQSSITLTDSAVKVNSDDGLVINNHSSAVGDFKSESASAAITTASINTYKVGPSITLGAGVWVIIGIWQFNNVSGARVTDVDLATDNSTSASTTTLLSRQRVSNAAGNWMRLETTSINEFTSDTTVYVKGSASVTSTAQTVYVKAVRIA